jgi:hypothetical protein
MENSEKIFKLEDEFVSIQKLFEKDLEIRCADLHSIRLSLINLPRQKDILIPNPYISYFLNSDINSFVHHTKQNIDQILIRINNNFTLNMISIFELYIKQGYGLLLALRKQKSMKFSAQLLNDHYKSEIEKFKTLGVLVNEIQDKINSIDINIIPAEKHYYEYCNNYILLRNCLAHNNGLITNNEIDMEIRLPIITEDQIQDVLKQNNDNKINPKTFIKKWKLNDLIKLELNEVEGIAYGLKKVSFVILKHLFKATDKHFEGIEKAKKQ